ncbi:MAG: radical SAM family heme chaperone HemW [Clostridia bacterium]
MKTKKRLGLYLHIPFCKSKCSYCDFYSIESDEKRIKEYVSSLLSHIKEYSEISTNYMLDTIYIGGGTPSVIGYKNLVLILKTVKKCFEISKDIDITVELNPESTDKKLLKALKKAGVNRISFGVQTSDNRKLREISRLHTFEHAKDVINLAKTIGFTNISVDLIYGLIGQTLDDVQSDLLQFLSLDVPHISTYALKIEEGTPLSKQNHEPLDDDLVADMYDYICKTLGQAGFEHYEISNFSKRGYNSRHNMKYWNLDEYLGLGPSAHSLFCDTRFGFCRDLDEYMRERTISEREETVPFDTRFGEYIMLKLRTKNGVDTDEFYRIFKRDFNDYMPKCKKFIDNGYAKYENGIFSLTEKGFFVSNYIINEIVG